MSENDNVADPESTTVIVPAYNEADGVGQLVAALAAAGAWEKILVVDDGSTDDTGEKALAAGAHVVRHPYNKGNGAAVKTGIRQATSTYVLIIDGDGQHRPEDAPRLVSRLNEFELVVGARSSVTQSTLGRRLGNRLLNLLASYLTRHPIPDLTSGFRAARREHFLEFLHLLPNGFSTPTTTTLAFVKAGYSIAFEPTEARARVGTSKINFASDGFKFFLILLRVITIFSPLRIFVPISAASLALGSGYGLWGVATDMRIPNGAVLLIVLGVLVFLIGLVSDQVSTLRFEGRGRE